MSSGKQTMMGPFTTFPNVRNRHLMHVVGPQVSATEENRVTEEEEANELQRRKY
jgi:hypothetical protein